MKHLKEGLLLFAAGLLITGCATTRQAVNPSSEDQVIEFVEEPAGTAPAEETEGNIVILDEEPAAMLPPTQAPQKEEIPAPIITQEPELHKQSQPVPEGAQEYKVWIWQETRDCLWNAAKKYYDDPWQWKKIFLANQDQIADPNIIFPKQVLIIPPVEQ